MPHVVKLYPNGIAHGKRSITAVRLDIYLRLARPAVFQKIKPRLAA